MTNGNIISLDGRIPLPALTRTVTNHITQEDTMLTARKTITNAEILTSPTVPVEILAAQGSGKVIFPIAAFISNFILTPYTNIGDECIISLFWYDGVSLKDARMAEIFNDTVASSTIATVLLTQSANANIGLAPGQNWNSNQAAFAANVISNPSLGNNSFVLSVGNFDSDDFNDLGNFTGGNTDNTITVTLFYALVDL